MSRYLIALGLLLASNAAFGMDFCDTTEVLNAKQVAMMQVSRDNYLVTIYSGLRLTAREKGPTGKLADKVPMDYYKCTIRKMDSAEDDIVSGLIFAIRAVGYDREEAFITAFHVSDDIASADISDGACLKPFKYLLEVAGDFMRFLGCKKMCLSSALCHYETDQFFQALGFDPSHKEKQF